MKKDFILKNIPLFLILIVIWFFALMSVTIWFDNTIGANITILLLVSLFTIHVIFNIIKRKDDSNLLQLKHELLFLLLIVIWALAFVSVFIWWSNNNVWVNALVFSILTILTIPLIFTVLKTNEKTNTNNSVEKRISIFSINFWNQSVNELRDLKKIIFVSILIAIMVGSRAFQIPTGFGPLQWRWAFIPWAIGGFLFGPITGMIMGLVYDVLAFNMFPMGFAFSIPFMFLNLLRGFTYGIVLYKGRITFTRLLILNIIITIPINTIGGAFAWAHMQSVNVILDFDIFLNQLFVLQLPRNVMVFIPQLSILIATFRYILPVLKNGNMLNDYPYIDEELTII